jgi:hypothetical protein
MLAFSIVATTTPARGGSAGAPPAVPKLSTTSRPVGASSARRRAAFSAQSATNGSTRRDGRPVAASRRSIRTSATRLLPPDVGAQ